MAPYNRRLHMRPNVIILVCVSLAVLAILVAGSGAQQKSLAENAAQAESYNPPIVELPESPTLPQLPAGSHALFVGDSWAEGVGATDKVNGNWAAITADHFKWRRTIDGVGGTGFTRGGGAGGGALGTDGKQYINRIKKWIGTLPEPPAIVVFEGGLNDDRAKPSVLYAAVREVVETTKAAWPNAAVIVIGPSAPQPLGAMLERMAEPIGRAAAEAGAFSVNPVQRGWFTKANSPQYRIPDDGAHVNDAGHAYTARQLAKAIEEMQK